MLLHELAVWSAISFAACTGRGLPYRPSSNQQPHVSRKLREPRSFLGLRATASETCRLDVARRFLEPGVNWTRGVGSSSDPGTEHAIPFARAKRNPPVAPG